MYKWYCKAGVLITCLVILFLFLALFPTKKNINKSVEGIQWEYDNEECENLTVTIEGQYVDYFLNFIKHDYFKGMITLSSQPYTVKADSFMYPVQFRRDYYEVVTFADGIHMGNLVYGNGYTEEIENLGEIFQKEPLEQGVILLKDSGGVISFPSQNRAEAAALTDEMLPDEVRMILCP